MNEMNGVIYILTNPSLPEYAKIRYADDIDKRLNEHDHISIVEVIHEKD